MGRPPSPSFCICRRRPGDVPEHPAGGLSARRGGRCSDSGPAATNVPAAPAERSQPTAPRSPGPRPPRALAAPAARSIPSAVLCVSANSPNFVRRVRSGQPSRARTSADGAAPRAADPPDARPPPSTRGPSARAAGPAASRQGAPAQGGGPERLTAQGDHQVAQEQQQEAAAAPPRHLPGRPAAPRRARGSRGGSAGRGDGGSRRGRLSAGALAAALPPRTGRGPPFA